MRELPLLAVVLLTATSRAQTGEPTESLKADEPAVSSALVDRGRESSLDRIVKGEIPGTHRWLVRLRTSSFSLDELKRASDEHRPAADVIRLIGEYERLAAEDMEPFRSRVVRLGGRVLRYWWIANGCLIEIPDDVVDGLLDDPDIRHMEPDYYWAPALHNPERSTGVYNHAADRAHAAGWTGIGDANNPPVIAILGAGINHNHAATGRAHKAFFVGGSTANPTRLVGVTTVAGALASLDNDDQGTKPGHETGVASAAAGADWLGAADPRSEDGQAPGVLIAAYNMAVWSPPLTFTVSSSSTQMNAWQQVLTDKVTSQRNILVANMSFGGAVHPNSLTQVALDRCADVGDILIVVAAGNEGSDLGDTQYCANGLVVGAVKPTHKTLPPADSRLISVTPTETTWSCYGVMNATTTATHNMHNRNWSPGATPNNRAKNVPDLVACGVGEKVAMVNNEGSLQVVEGTSAAAPHVAGAAVLFRTGPDGSANNPVPSALETKAAILATTEDISQQNVGLGGIGAGFLRTDRLTSLQSANQLSTSLVQVSGGSLGVVHSRTLAVTQGETYSFSIAWNRTQYVNTPGTDDWPDLDLQVVGPGGTVAASSGLPHDTHEEVRFTAAASGMATVDVTLQANPGAIASITFALATCTVTAPSRAGATSIDSAKASAFGAPIVAGCTSTHQASSGPGTTIQIPNSNLSAPYPTDIAPPGAGTIRDHFIVSNPTLQLEVAIPFDLPAQANRKIRAISLLCKAGKRRKISMRLTDTTGSLAAPYDYWRQGPVIPFPLSLGRPGATTFATLEMQVGTTEQFYTAPVYWDATLPQDQSGFLVITVPEDFDFTYDNAKNALATGQPLQMFNWGSMMTFPVWPQPLPQQASPNIARAPYWFYLTRSPGSPTWSVNGNQAGSPANTARTWNLRFHLLGSDVAPELYYSHLPKLGSNDFSVNLRHGAPNAPYMLLWGLSQTQINLGGGCFQLSAYDLGFYTGLVQPVSPSVPLGAAIPPPGGATIPIPLDPNILGLRTYHQFLILNSGAISSSNGGDWTIGW